MNELLNNYNKLHSRREKRLYALKTCLNSKWKHLLMYEKLSQYSIDVIFYEYINVKMPNKTRNYTPKFKEQKKY